MTDNIAIVRKRVFIKGIVQGVGFRPYIYNKALEWGIAGYTNNQGSFLVIEVQGEEDKLKKFIDSILSNPPARAKIEEIEINDIPVILDSNIFTIKKSESDETSEVFISPDIAICRDCRDELFSNTDTRYRYPFINCTNCGPRFSIIKDTPYDRKNTVMNIFDMCQNCCDEYSTPNNRRYHAQPISCFNCGPVIEMCVSDQHIYGEYAISKAHDLLLQGKIIAIKGIGGYHLACNALDNLAVKRLREKKHRDEKPFAVMAKLDTIKGFADVSPKEEECIISPQAPIVILSKGSNYNLSEDVSLDLNTIGVMVPYTPLHLLLLANLDVLVMTSGNISNEPICYTNEEAIARLSHIADAFLMHNRDINVPIDDSVMSVFENKTYMIRRARGFVPDPICFSISKDIQPVILAVGGDLKNTFCIKSNNKYYLSQHFGDLENLETFNAFQRSIDAFKTILKTDVDIIACDKHPNYLSSGWAGHQNKPIVEVQHHKAHIASLLGEKNITADVMAVAFDGTGFGDDGKIWGGEFFVGNYLDLKRVAHLEYVPIQGGDSAVLDHAKTYFSYLYHCGRIAGGFDNMIINLLKKQINVFETSSAGRLFDAAAYAAGIRQNLTYDAQAAILFEKSCQNIYAERDIYSYDTFKDHDDMLIIKTAQLINSITEEQLNNIPLNLMAEKFHRTVADMIVNTCCIIREKYNINQVVLSGGVFQNLILLEYVCKKLSASDFITHTHSNIPANDGGLSLGQAILAGNQF